MNDAAGRFKETAAGISAQREYRFGVPAGLKMGNRVVKFILLAKDIPGA
jgi:hypothetical protein